MKNYKSPFNKEFIKALFTYCIEKDVSQHSKALSFSTLLAIVPLISIFFGSFASSPWFYVAKEKFQLFLIENLVPTAIQTVFINYLNIMSINASHIKTIGIILFFFSILFLFLDIEKSFADLAHRPINSKWYVRVISIASLFFVPVIFFILLASIEWLVRQTPDVFQNILYSFDKYSFILKGVILFLVWGWISFLYIIIPNRKIHLKYSFFGAALTTVFFILSQQLFALYLADFSSYTLIYGIFSIIPIFILWIYLNWQIVLYGLVITFFYEKYYGEFN